MLSAKTASQFGGIAAQQDGMIGDLASLDPDDLVAVAMERHAALLA